MSIRSHINRTVGLVVAGVVGGVVGVGYAAHAAFAPVETQQVSDVTTPAPTTPTETVTQTVTPSTTEPSPTTTEAPKPSASPTSTYAPPAPTTTEATVTDQPEPTQPATQPAAVNGKPVQSVGPSDMAKIKPDMGNAPQYPNGLRGPGGPLSSDHPTD